MRHALRHAPGLATLLLLLAAVVLPMAGMSWLLFRGVASERVASEHRLMRAQQARLETARAALESHWQQLDSRVSALLQSPGTPALHFQRLLETADSAILLDDAGAVSYPDQPRPPVLNHSPADSIWEQARGLEAVGDLLAASETYAVLAARSWEHDRSRPRLAGAGPLPSTQRRHRRSLGDHPLPAPGNETRQRP